MNNALPEQIIVFNLDGELLAIDVTSVQEILPTRPCRSMPDTAAHVQGLMTFRGQVIPLINLGIMLSIAPSVSDGSTIIIGQGGQNVGLMVDGVDEVIAVGDSLEPLSVTGLRVGHGFVHGLAVHNERAVTVLKSSEILSSLEV